MNLDTWKPRKHHKLRNCESKANHSEKTVGGRFRKDQDRKRPQTREATNKGPTIANTYFTVSSTSHKMSRRVTRSRKKKKSTEEVPVEEDPVEFVSSSIVSTRPAKIHRPKRPTQNNNGLRMFFLGMFVAFSLLLFILVGIYYFKPKLLSFDLKLILSGGRPHAPFATRIYRNINRKGYFAKKMPLDP